jgi:hypothetical protein
MLIIGSHAAIFNKIHNGEEPRDTDVIGTFAELQSLIKELKKDALRETHAAGVGLQICAPIDASHWHIRDHNGWNYEFEIAWPGSSGELLLKLEGNEEGREGFASKEACLALKLSHRFKKDSPHFLKTMRDVQAYKAAGIVLTPELENLWLPQREAETYTYNHPKLNVDKGEFFSGDGVRYVYDHDTIHLAVALLSEPPACCVPTAEEEAMLACGDYQPEELWGSSKPSCPKCFNAKSVARPAYTFYMQDGAQVMTDADKFFSCSTDIRLFGVYEEACVLALERSQIPFDFKPDPRYSFEMALMKVCTSITSGWFRWYAWENYDKVLDLYNQLGENDYIERFKRNAHLLKPFKGETI